MYVHTDLELAAATADESVSCILLNATVIHITAETFAPEVLALVWFRKI